MISLMLMATVFDDKRKKKTMHIYIIAFKMKRICSVAREESIVNGSETVIKKKVMPESRNSKLASLHRCLSLCPSL